MILDTEKHQLLAKIAYLYYIGEKNQKDIAQNLNIHRSTVSRMLQEARDKGIVQIQIKDFNNEIFNLERRAKNKFNLNHLEVVFSEKNENKTEINNLIGRRASILIHRLIKNGDKVGLSWGSSLAATVDHVEPKYTKDTLFVPSVGGSTQIDASNHVNTLVYELARKFQGNNLFVNASVIQETPEIARKIVGSKYFKELRSTWNNLDKIIVGIGGNLGIQDSSWRDFLSNKDRHMLKEKNVIGDCCCRFFDKHGNIVGGDLYNRTIGITLSKLRETPLSIGIAAGEDKALAIYVLLKNGYLNSLVTDHLTLRKVLEISNKYEQ